MGITIDSKLEGRQVESQEEPMILFSRVNMQMFGGNANVMVEPKKLLTCTETLLP